MRWRFVAWLLHHPSRTSWILTELLRPLPVSRRLTNAWWQARHFGDVDAFHALWLTYSRSQDAAKQWPPSSSGSVPPVETEQP